MDFSRLLSRREEAEKMEVDGKIKVYEVQKPPRKVLVKRGVKAADYMAYCEEVGCEIWDELLAMVQPGEEPVSLWLPEGLRAGGSEYVQGVEVPAEYAEAVPAGFDAVELPAARYLVFHGPVFADEDYEEAIAAVWAAMAGFDPGQLGFAWDDTQPRVQLEPRGERGYMEMRAVRVK